MSTKKYIYGELHIDALTNDNTLSQLLVRDPDGIIKYKDASSITTYNVSKSELDILINTSELVIGALYTITDCDILLYGGTTLILEAISNNTLNESGVGLFYNPKYDQITPGFKVWTNLNTWSISNNIGLFDPNETITANNGATGQLFSTINSTQFIITTGDWNTAVSFIGDINGGTADIVSIDFMSIYNTNDIVHWGGKSWTNINGNLGSVIDIFTLDNEWTVIPFNTSDYNLIYDEIKYDYLNDTIIYRNEQNSNIVSFDIITLDLNIFNNPIKAFMWGNLLSINPSMRGIGNQKIINSYNENINFRGARQNDIAFNNLSYQKNIIFETGSIQQNIIFNNSYQINITFTLEASQNIIELTNSYQNNIIFNNSYQTFFNFTNSYQTTLIFDMSNQAYLIFLISNQTNLNFNNSTQNTLNFIGSNQITLNFTNASYQTNLYISDNSTQNNLVFSDNSYQTNIKLIHGSTQSGLILSGASHQQNIEFSNASYQETVSLVLGSIQENLVFNNSSYHLELSLNNATQRNLTFNNASGQEYLVSVNFNQQYTTFNNYVIDRSSTPLTTNENNKVYNGTLETTTNASTILVMQNNKFKTQTVSSLIPSGKIYINNQTTGIPIYYATPELAVAAAVSGDTIVVYSGTYTLTLTTTNGYAKDGVTWKFYPNVIFNKATIGDVFNDSGFTIGCNIYGYPNINKTGSDGHIFYYTQNLNFTIEYGFLVNTAVGTCISLKHTGFGTNIVSIKGISAIASAGICYDIQNLGFFNIDFGVLIKSTSTYAWQSNIVTGAGVWDINKGILRGEQIITTAGVYSAYIRYTQMNVDVTYSNYVYTDGTMSVNWNGGIDRLFAGWFKHSGYIIRFDGGNDLIELDRVGFFIATLTGYCSINYLYGNSGLYNNSLSGGGTLVIYNQKDNILNWLANSGSTLIIKSKYVASTYNASGGGLVMTNGRVVFEKGFIYPNGQPAITMSGTAIVELETGTCENTYSSAPSNGSNIPNVIDHRGGTLILRNPTLKTAHVDAEVIVAPTIPVSIYVQPVMLSNRVENGGVLIAKKQKLKLSVGSVSAQSITLNDGSGGNETFTITDLVTYDTLAKQAQQFATLINASGTLDLTATQDTPGTDVYLYIEADVAGVPFVYIAAANSISNPGTTIRKNSFTITNIIDGTITEDINVK